MNAEKRGYISSYFNETGLAFAEKELVGYTSEGIFCKIGHKDCVGLAGFTGRAFKNTDVTEMVEIAYGTIDLGNDPDAPVQRQHLYGNATVVLVDGFTVSLDESKAADYAPSVIPFNLSGDKPARVTIFAAPPGAG